MVVEGQSEHVVACTYTLTPEDYTTIAREDSGGFLLTLRPENQDPPDSRTRTALDRRFLGLIWGLILLIISMVLLTLLFDGRTQAWVIPILLISGLVALYISLKKLTKLWRIVYKDSQSRSATTTVSRPSAALKGVHALREPCTVTVSKEGVVFEAGSYFARQGWVGIAVVRATQEFVYILREDRVAFVIPARAVPQGSTMKELETLFRAWHDASGKGETARLAFMLSELEYLCEGCDYNLRGVTGKVCPECGVGLDFWLVQREFFRVARTRKF